MSMLPNGFTVAGHHCGLKQATQDEDLALFLCAGPSVAAGVYTQNQIVAAPVLIDRQRTPNASTRAVIINAGNANACTGEQGLRNAHRMIEKTATATGVKPAEVLIMSTGIIGEQLPMDVVEQGIELAANQLAATDEALQAAARGILTTDTKTKIATTSSLNRVTGIAKGSGMIGPNMATMLSLIMTDATLHPTDAQQLLAAAVDKSFNAINVDGHTSTNDTVLLLASGRDTPLEAEELAAFSRDLTDVCTDLAKQIVDDGEGATHLIAIEVTGAESDADARVIAEAIANSPLVKTAMAGNDPNWGRIVSAAGYAGPPLDLVAMELTLNGVSIFRNATPVEFDAKALSTNLAANREVRIQLRVGSNNGSARYWTCDLTHGYVTINADYHT